ncbi:MAG TPA: portal protein, partial [Methanothrix sp.]|nr:portal protein [Methanothrix sp.]
MITYEQAQVRLRDMKAERSNWESLWRDVASYVLPRRLKEEERTSGQNLYSLMYDSTAERANNRLAAV